MSKRKTKKPDALVNHKRESALLKELQDLHGYMLGKLTPKHERFPTMWRGLGSGKATCKGGVACKLVVPSDSALGKAMLAVYSKPEKPARKPATKRVDPSGGG